MLSWAIWLVRSAAAWFLLLLALVLLIFIFASKDKLLIGGLAAMFAIAGFFSMPRMPNAWRRDPPTAKQIKYAESLGIQVVPGMTKGDVSALISQVSGR